MKLFHKILMLTIISFCRGLCPLVECECDDGQLKVECLGMTLREIPITLNPHIGTLTIRDSQLKRLDAALQFYPHLKILDLSSNAIELVPPLCFEHQQGLVKLNLNSNAISYVDTQAFVGLTNLTSLSLRGNILTSLDPLQFTGLQNLVELDISGNRLFSITPEAFEGLNRLETLRLDFNRLTAIPLEALIRLPVLTNLYLSHNSLHTMSVNQPYSNDKTELALSPLRFINLSYTHLARMELCHLLDLTRHLDHLVFMGNSPDQLACIESNSIKVLEIGDMDTLTSLDPIIFYSMSKLTSLKVTHSPNLATVTQDAFMANTALERVEIRDNPKLEEISLDAFTHLFHLKHLSLNNNSLLSVYLDRGINDSERLFAELSDMDISNNPLDCNCTLKSLSLYLKPDRVKCHTNKSPIDTFHLGNLLTGDLTCLSPHTVKVLFLGTLTVVIIAVVAISVIVHLVHFRRNQKEQQLIKEDNSNVGNLLMSLRRHQPASAKIVTNDLNSSIISSLAWHESIGQQQYGSHGDLLNNLSEKERQQQQQQQLQQQHFHLQPLGGVLAASGGHYSMPVNSATAARYHPGEPLCFIDLNSSATPCQCNYSFPYSNNWS